MSLSDLVLADIQLLSGVKGLNFYMSIFEPRHVISNNVVF